MIAPSAGFGTTPTTIRGQPSGHITSLTARPVPGRWPTGPSRTLRFRQIRPTTLLDGTVEDTGPVIHEGASVADDEERTWTGSVENHP